MHGLHRSCGQLLRSRIVLWKLRRGHHMPFRVFLCRRCSGQGALRSRHLLGLWCFIVLGLQRRDLLCGRVLDVRRLRGRQILWRPGLSYVR